MLRLSPDLRPGSLLHNIGYMPTDIWPSLVELREVLATIMVEKGIHIAVCTSGSIRGVAWRDTSTGGVWEWFSGVLRG